MREWTPTTMRARARRILCGNGLPRGALAEAISGAGGQSVPWLGSAVAVGMLSGGAIAVLGLNGLYLCLCLLGVGLILRDFRIGVVLLILLMPISGSQVFPREMLGITGLNPFNLLLVATLGSYLLTALFDGSLHRFVPPPLLWLFVVPFLLAGLNGTRHLDEIAPGFYNYQLISFTGTGGYVRDMVAKPLLMIVFALLVGAAVTRSERPDRFLIPTIVSMWIMGLMAIVFVNLSGGSLPEMAGTGAREFLSPLGMHANQLGRLYAIAFALLLFTWAESKQHMVRLVLVFSMGMVGAALLLTFSRSAFGGLVIVIGLFLLWRRDVRALSFFGLFALIALFALPGAVYDRITTGFGEGLNAISAGRVDDIWMPLFPEVLKSPIIGSGLGSTLWTDAMRTGAGTSVAATTHPHSAYLQALLDMGIVGLALLCLYFAHVWRGFGALREDLMQSPPALRGFYTGASAGLVAFLIAAVVDGALTPRPEQSFLWVAIGMMYGQLRRAK